jgi:hypothetical protein
MRSSSEDFFARSALADQRQGDLLGGDGSKDLVCLLHGGRPHDRFKYDVRLSFSLRHGQQT